MTDNKAKAPVWFWIIAAAALLWNAIGVMSFLTITMMSADNLAAMPEVERALYESTPIWATAAFAIAVFGGLFGSLMLLLRNGLATTLFMASLAGIIIQFTRWLFFTNAPEVYGAETYFMPGLVTVIAVFLLWFSTKAKGNGWIA